MIRDMRLTTTGLEALSGILRAFWLLGLMVLDVRAVSGLRVSAFQVSC